MNGTSTQGTWNFVISDQAAADAGTVDANGLSLIVTPRSFVCALAPTAANASVSGRVFNADGRAVSRAVVKLTTLDGETRTVITNAFGYYRFEEVAVGQTYSFSISGKKLIFPTRFINVNEDIEDLNFTADR